MPLVSIHPLFSVAALHPAHVMMHQQKVWLVHLGYRMQALLACKVLLLPTERHPLASGPIAMYDSCSAVLARVALLVLSWAKTFPFGWPFLGIVATQWYYWVSSGVGWLMFSLDLLGCPEGQRHVPERVVQVRCKSRKEVCGNINDQME